MRAIPFTAAEWRNAAVLSSSLLSSLPSLPSRPAASSEACAGCSWVTAPALFSLLGAVGSWAETRLAGNTRTKASTATGNSLVRRDSMVLPASHGHSGFENGINDFLRQGVGLLVQHQLGGSYIFFECSPRLLEHLFSLGTRPPQRRSMFFHDLLAAGLLSFINNRAGITQPLLVLAGARFCRCNLLLGFLDSALSQAMALGQHLLQLFMDDKTVSGPDNKQKNNGRNGGEQ